jgi:hypothetical protein
VTRGRAAARIAGSALAICAVSVVVASAAAPVVITFEDLPASGYGTGLQTVLTNQYQNRGVVFANAALLDFSKGIAIPEFAHSGTRAIMHCYSIEFCNAPFAVGFTSPQSRIKVWVGYKDRLPEGGRVVLTASDSQKNVVGQEAGVLPANQWPIPIRIPLEIRVAEPTITSATLSVEGFQSGITALAADDLEFERISPPDLAIQSVTPRVDERGHVAVIVGVVNAGEQASRPTVVQALSDAWPPASGNVKELAAGEATLVEIPILEPLKPGTYSFRLLVDPERITGDTNRDNNTQSAEVVVTASPPPPPAEPLPLPTEPSPSPAVPASTTPEATPTPPPPGLDARVLWIAGILLGAGIIAVLRLSRAKPPSRPVVRPVFRPVWNPGSQDILPASSPGDGIDLRLRTRQGASIQRIEETNPLIEGTEE